MAFEIGFLLIYSLFVAFDNWFQGGIQPVLRPLRIKVDRGKTIDLFFAIEPEIRELCLKIVEQVRISALAQQCFLVVGSKGFLKLLCFVHEIEHHCFMLAWIGAVKPREGLYRIDALAALRGMGLIYDDGKAFSRQ